MDIKDLPDAQVLFQASGGRVRTKRAWIEWAAWIFNAGITPRDAKRRRELVNMPKDLWIRVVEVLELKRVSSRGFNATALQAFDTYKYFDIDNKEHGDI